MYFFYRGLFVNTVIPQRDSIDHAALKHNVTMVFHNGTLIRTMAKKGFVKI